MSDRGESVYESVFTAHFLWLSLSQHHVYSDKQTNKRLTLLATSRAPQHPALRPHYSTTQYSLAGHLSALNLHIDEHKHTQTPL